MSADPKGGTNNCVICHESATKSNSVSLHIKLTSVDHRLHYHCLQSHIARDDLFLCCPSCDAFFDEEIATHYCTPEAALAASLRKDDLELTIQQLRGITSSKEFCHSLFYCHFSRHVRHFNADLTKLQTIFEYLELKYTDSGDPLTIATFGIIQHASLLFSLKEIFPDDYEYSQAY